MIKYVTREEKTGEFADIMGQQNDGPISVDQLALRMRLIEEEFQELHIAVEDVKWACLGVERKDDATQLQVLSNLIKELSDLQYVVSGFASTFGINLDVAFNRIHQSNLSKLDENGKPVLRDDGKVMKGPNYREPNFEDAAKDLLARVENKFDKAGFHVEVPDGE